jgi:hypothetical protein
MKTSAKIPTSPHLKSAKKATYHPDLSVEYFHIYTDEEINGRHARGLDYLKAIEQAWGFKYAKIILIDDYNPTEHKTTADQVLNYLKQHEMSPDHWAYEKNLVANAKQLLETISSKRLKDSYHEYIAKHNKYPCSLLTASWYLTRLGKFDHTEVISQTGSKPKPFKPAKRLVNILPQDYRAVEERAMKLIKKSEHFDAIHSIQDLFYPIESEKALDLF